jgi:hypothetical protein
MEMLLTLLAGVDWNEVQHLGVLGTVLLLGLKALVHWGPRLAVPFLHNVLEAVRLSAWLNDPARPERRALFRAALVWADSELPDQGQGREVYAALGAWLVRLPLTLSALAPAPLKPPLLALAALFAGSGKSWAAAAAAFGDAADLELKAELQALDAPAGATPAPHAPPAG